MTTKWADGFEDTAEADLGVDYTTTGTLGTALSLVTGRRTGTSALRCNASSASVRRTIGGTGTTVFQSAAINYQTLSASATTGRHFMRFMEGSTVHVALFATTGGNVAAYRGDMTTLLGTSGSAFFVTGQWTWLQCKVVVHDSTGSVEVRDASGNVVLALTGIDTRNGGTGFVDTVLVGPTAATGSQDIYFDDWHVWDSTGSICNTWTDDTRVDHKVASGTGNSAQFTASAGANWSCTDDAPFNTTDYVESATAGHIDSYAFGDIAHSPPNIFSVLVTAVAQKDDAGARALKPLARVGGTNYAAASSTTLNQGSYVRVVDVRETDPSTAAAWTQSGFNGAEFGFENV